MSTGTGLRSFALVAAVFLAISWVRLDPGGTKVDAGNSAPSSAIEAGAASSEFVDEPVVDETGATVLDAQGKPVTRKVVSGGSAGTEARAGTAGSTAGAGTTRTTLTPGTGRPATGGTGGTTGGTAGPAGGTEGQAGGTSGGGATVGGGRSGGADSGTNPDGSAIECKAGKNGGATDTGVTATKIRLATTAVLDGEAKSLLEPSVTAMKAVRDKINRAGGICGRLLELNVVNDSFNASNGQTKIKNFIAEGYFAMPVVPSAEGLGAAIEAGDISAAGIPVIGTDGMRKEQYNDPWVFPVASATVTAMRVMAKYGYADKGARTFAIVYDDKYKFGKEGKDAFVAQVQALGGTVVIEQALNPADSSYATQAGAFNTKCGENKCDMVAMLLLPDTAAKWMARQPALGRVYTAGAQTLFTNRFAQDCVQAAGVRCDGIAVWTGYNPPIGPIASKPGVAQYVNDVKALDPGIDVNNQFLEGAYLGMSVFVDALKKVGPNLTRSKLQEVMNGLDYTTDLASTLSWRPGDHAANVRSQSFSMVVSQGTFNGWRDDGTGFRLDPAKGG